MSMAQPADDHRDLFGEQRGTAARTRQLPLPLGWRRANDRLSGKFVVGESNRNAVQHVLGFADWTVPASILIGPERSGRTMLGALFIDAGGAELIDGLRDADEEALFHAWNRAQLAGTRLLVIAGSAAEIDAVILADLKTRLATAPVVTIGAPDACLTRDLVEQLLIERGLHPAPQLGGYVAARIERSYAAIHAAVAAIDRLALATGGGAGIRSARAALIAAGLYDADDSDSTETV